MNNCVISKPRLMERIAMCEFTCIDLNLYLDTHPNDAAALSDYNFYAEQLAQLKDLYVENYGPLENFGNSLSYGSWNDWDFSGYMFQGRDARISGSCGAQSSCGCSAGAQRPRCRLGCGTMKEV